MAARRKKLSRLDAWVDDNNLDDANILKADGYDDAVIGVCSGCGQPDRLVYDREKIIEILMSRDGMDYEEAEEHFGFNILGSYMGPTTPLYLTNKYEPNQEKET